METARIILDYLKVLLSWPVLVIAIILFFLLKYKSSVKSILSRLERVKGPVGTEAILRQEALTKNSNSTETMEKQLQKEIAKLEDEKEEFTTFLNNVVIPSMRQLETHLDFERIYSFIYGSQLRLLKHLSELGNRGDSYVNVYSFYQEMLGSYPSGIKISPFSFWVGFPRTHGLIEVSGQEEKSRTFSITGKGIDFLEYIKAQYGRFAFSRSF